MAELEELEQEELDKNLLEISGPETVPLPNVPSIALPSKPAKKKEEEDNDMKDLEKWAGSSAGWARFLVACAASWRVHVRGRQDGCGAGRFHRSRLSLQSSGTALLLTLHSMICTWWDGRGRMEERGSGGKCLLFIMLNFCKINCLQIQKKQILEMSCWL